jgi:signal transduction histidine kinase/DNA-binding response OmpR family regulator
MVYIYVSQLMVSSARLVRIYCAVIFSLISVALMATLEPAVSPLVFLLIIAFCLISNQMLMAKWISDRKSLEQNELNLREARDSAQEAVKTRIQFMANMSHEIRTPLNGIIGMTSMLETTSLDDSQEDMVETIRMSGHLLLTIINDILDFSKLEVNGIVLERNEVDIEQCAAQCVELLLPLAMGKGIDLFLDIDPDVPRNVNCDSTKVSQVLVNLLNNAVKYTDQGEVCLTISADNPSAPNCALTFSISDTGIGISESQQRIIFEEFAQADASATRRFGGTGLGLTICRGLLDAMGGEITLQSAPGQGSRFTVRLPVDTVIPIEQPPEFNLELKGKNVLLAVSNQTQRRILSKYLRGWETKLHSVTDTQKMFKHLRAMASSDLLPDFVVTDLENTGLSAKKLIAEIEKVYQDKQPRIVMISTYKKRNYRCGSGFVLINPIRPTTLQAIMEKGLVEEETASITPVIARNMDNSTGSDSALRILLVEDNSVNQKVACSMLEKLGYQADVAANGLEAIVQVNVGNYDVVFMDVQMPEMDGLMATKKIRQLPVRQPEIVAMTANVFQKDREDCIDAGMDGFMAKPIKLRQLSDALMQIENHHPIVQTGSGERAARG